MVPSNPSSAVRNLQDFNSAGQKHSYAPSRSKQERRKPDLLTYLAAHSANDISYEDPPMCVIHLSKVTPMVPNVIAYFLQAIGIATNNISVTAYLSNKTKNPDTLTFDEAMRDVKNLTAWRLAAVKEITELQAKECWEECLKSEAIDKGKQMIPTTWVFWLKRNPAGEITKFKARICLRGDLMDDDEESYAPVVSWSTVRFFLIIANMLGWHTVSVDWSNAFIHAKLKEPMYMATPRGFTNQLYGALGCLRVTKSLYGSEFAPRN